MPDFYTLTSPKLYGVIQRILADEATAAPVLTDVFQHIWNTRDDLPFPLTMNTLVTIAQRFALDHKMAGAPIARVKGRPPTISRQLSDLSDADLNILAQVCAAVPYGPSGPSHQPLKRDDLLARLGALKSNESPS